MTKAEFLDALTHHLADLPGKEIAERRLFYSEMIDDRIEEGVSESEAVASVGNIETVVRQIREELSAEVSEEDLVCFVPKAKKKGRLRKWEITLIALGSPIWLSLLIAAFAVWISLYAVIWALLISAWTIFVSLIGGSAIALFCGIVFIIRGSFPVGVFSWGVALILLGLSIFVFDGCRAASRAVPRITIGAFRVAKRLLAKEKK